MSQAPMFNVLEGRLFFVWLWLPPVYRLTVAHGKPGGTKRRHMGLSENWGTLFWGPYNEDPTI